MSRRTVLSAVGATNGAFEVAARRIAVGHQAQRSFTSTARRNATNITHFTPTSSPELDELLSTIRTKLILPSYLTLAQRKKIYSPKYEKKLQADPIIMEIDGEVLKFRHLNPVAGDVPSAWKSAMGAIQRFETDADFANLQPLLEGIHNSAQSLSHAFYAKVIRIVCTKGHLYDIIECARGAKRTGLKLDSSEKVNELLHFVQLKAADAGWAKNETEQALRWAEIVVDLLEEEAHQPKRWAVADGGLPLNRDPQVLMAPLHLAAALVVKSKAGGEAAVEKANKYARDVVRLWPEGKGLKQVHPEKFYREGATMGYFNEPNKFLALATPLLHGLELATQAVSVPELSSQLLSRFETLSAEVEAARQQAVTKGKARRGTNVYNQFFGAKSEG